MAKTLYWYTLWIIFFSSSTQKHILYEDNGICLNVTCNTAAELQQLTNCTVILGNLKVVLIEKARKEDYLNMSFPDLKEVTGYVVIYRVSGLESVGHLFPNLARIRGDELLHNFALIVYDMPDLNEIGLYNLLKIDRGGVIISGSPPTCYVDTIDWKSITPRYRHVVISQDNNICRSPCTCSSRNFCWNNKKCQRFLEGPEAEVCDSKCLGCQKTNSSDCTLCRERTYAGRCVAQCPNGTILLRVNQYCLAVEECIKLGGWSWQNECVFDCPADYMSAEESGTITCKPCVNCKQTCGSTVIQTLASIQEAAKCVYINGSLTIHVYSIPEVVEELRFYLKRIQEVSDYIHIYDSIVITSLDFLPSLRRIGGRRLFDNKYSLVINNMQNLQKLLPLNATRNLKANRGTMKFFYNPILCMSEIKELQRAFPERPSDLDVPQGLNGYSGSCEEVALGLNIKVVNETSAVATFVPEYDANVHYSILYLRIPYGLHPTFIPETCSDSEWFAVSVSVTSEQLASVELTQLHPASRYAVCVEKYDPTRRQLARSAIVNFTTHIGKPEPPFIVELVASSSEAIVIRWVDHLDYRPYITQYQLDVTLIEIREKDIAVRDQCAMTEKDLDDLDYSRHAMVMRPPSNYGKGCESICGVLSTVTFGAMVEEDFDVCKIIGGCDDEVDPPDNSTLNGFVQTLVLDLSGNRSEFQVGGLAPFRDYRFRLRACTATTCSRSARSVVRTLRSELAYADIPTITFISAQDDGLIEISWDAPVLANGPVLAYTMEIIPKQANAKMALQTWCVFGNVTNTSLKVENAMRYEVRICSSTLAYSNVCSEWKKVNVSIKASETKSETKWWWTGVLFGILLYLASSVIGWKLWKPRRRSDDMPLIDRSSAYRNVSEPPAIMMSDFVPFYNIPLRDTNYS